MDKLRKHREEVEEREKQDRNERQRTLSICHLRKNCKREWEIHNTN